MSKKLKLLRSISYDIKKDKSSGTLCKNNKENFTENPAYSIKTSHLLLCNVVITGHNPGHDLGFVEQMVPVPVQVVVKPYRSVSYIVDFFFIY